MKVQLQGQQIRLRVDEDELAELLDGGEVFDATIVDELFEMRRGLVLGDDAEARLLGDTESWRIALPHGEVRALASRLPSRDGLRFTLPGSAEPLELLFDVDVRDSVRRRHG
jgi:hypothetical protein